MATIFSSLLLAFVLIGLNGSVGLADSSKEWTVYIHMNADNSLCKFSANNLKEIKSLDVSANANIIVAYDCNRKNDSRLIEIRGQNEIDLLEGTREFDMGDIVFFTDTAMEAFRRYPADKRMIIFWNHGSGWDLQPKNMNTTGVSYDDNSGNHFTIAQVGEAIKAISSAYPIEIIGFDACLMQTIEVLYEYHDYAKYTLASEDFEPGKGWNYTAIVKGINEHLSSEDLAKGIIDLFVANNTYNSVTLSLIDNRKIKELSAELSRLIPTLQQQSGIKKIIASLPEWDQVGCDMGAFFEKLKMIDVSSVKRVYQEAVLYSKNTEPATGLGIYLRTPPDSSYRQLKFAQETGWFDLLRNLK